MVVEKKERLMAPISVRGAGRASKGRTGAHRWLAGRQMAGRPTALMV